VIEPWVRRSTATGLGPQWNLSVKQRADGIIVQIDKTIADVITYAKFQVEIFRGYDFTGGRISHFPIDFCMGITTVQRECAACDYIDQCRRAE